LLIFQREGAFDFTAAFSVRPRVCALARHDIFHDFARVERNADVVTRAAPILWEDIIVAARRRLLSPDRSDTPGRPY